MRNSEVYSSESDFMNNIPITPGNTGIS